MSLFIFALFNSSNCVVNLTADKAVVLKQAYRVLKVRIIFLARWFHWKMVRWAKYCYYLHQQLLSRWLIIFENIILKIIRKHQYMQYSHLQWKFASLTLIYCSVLLSFWVKSNGKFWQFEVSLLFYCQNYESGWLRVQIFSQTMDFLDFRCCEFCFHCCIFFCPLYKHSVVIPFRMEVKYILVMFTQIQISPRKPEKTRYFGVRFSSLFCLIL